MTMKWNRPQLPANSLAATILIISLILAGGGLLGWNTSRLVHAERSELSENAKNIVFVPTKPTPQSLRLHDKIKIYRETPQKMTLSPSPNNEAQVISRVPTDKPVIFITIDDGTYKIEQTKKFIEDRELPVTSFLTIFDIENDFNFFKPSKYIENHTYNHPHMMKLPFESQRVEICKTSELLEQVYGKRPTLMRPPFGEYNVDTLRAAHACGIKAVVMWSAVAQQGAMHYQKEPHLKSGDIVLLHYMPELQSDLEMLLKTAHDQGMEVAQLEDWIQ